jgi:hypothetical protein
MKLVPDSTNAQRRSDELGLPFYDAAIEINGHNIWISLVFSDLAVQSVDPDYAPRSLIGQIDACRIHQVG